MNKLPLTPVMLSFHGIEGIGRKSLTFLLSSQKTATYEVTEEHPDAIRIIDIDDYRGKAAWESLLDSEEALKVTPVIILGREPVTVENGIVLQKPFRPRQLLDAIESLTLKSSEAAATSLPNEAQQTNPASCDISGTTRDHVVSSANDKPVTGLSQSAASSLNEREVHAFVGTTPDVDLNNPNAIGEIFYDPGQFLAQRLLESIKLAAKEGRYIRIGCCDVAFYIDPQARCIRTLVKEKNLRTFGALPIDFNTFEHHQESRLPAEVETLGFSFSYDDFLWRMILASSRGRLPENIDLDQRFVLRRWPNLTRLLLFPHATQISAAWIASPKSIKEIIQQLNVPQRYVFAFFAATHLMALLTPIGPSNLPATEPAVEKQHNSRGLFRRLLKTLYRKKGGA